MATNTTSTGPVMAVAASAMRAQQARMRVIAENIANADSTAKSPGADPYRRQMPVFQPIGVEGGGQGVKLSKVTPDPTAFKLEYAPGHPAADKNGYIYHTNVDLAIEQVNSLEASRAYEANVTMMETTKAMFNSSLRLIA